MKAMCEIFGVSRAAYYAWEGKLEEMDPDQELMEKIQAAYETSHKSCGYRQITIQLRCKQGIIINHKAVLRLTLAPARKCRCAQAGYPFASQKAQNVQKTGRNRDVPSLSQCTQSGLCRDKTKPEVGHRCHLHSHLARLGLSIHHQGSLRWLHCGACL